MQPQNNNNGLMNNATNPYHEGPSNANNYSNSNNCNPNNPDSYAKPYQNNNFNMSDDIPPTPSQSQNCPNTERQSFDIVVLKEKEKDPLEHLNNGLEGSARKNFIKKVYLVLGCQLLFTIGMCFISFYSQPFLRFQIEHYWLMYVSIGLLLVTEITIFCCPAGRQHPINLILLLVFTLAESYFLSFITSLFAYTEGAAVVVMAACMTLFIVICLTLYAIFTPTDFTTKWGLVIALIAPMIMLGIFSWIAWTPVLTVLYCSLGCILFGFYLVIDTQLIIGGRKFQLSLDDYVIGALLLYIDIIQIFLYLLMILGGRR